MGIPVTVGTSFVLAEPLIIVDASGTQLAIQSFGGIKTTLVDSNGTAIALSGGLSVVAATVASVVTEKTRPADTTAYAANDAIAESTSAPTSWAFSIGRVNGGSGQIIAALFATDQATCTARLELDLYSTNVGNYADNVEAAQTYTLFPTYLGTITAPNLAKKTGNSSVAVAQVGLNIPFKCGAASTTIYGLMRTLDAFTPASGQKVSVILEVIQN